MTTLSIILMLFIGSTQTLVPVTVMEQSSYENIDHCTEDAADYNDEEKIYVLPNGNALVLVARCDTPI